MSDTLVQQTTADYVEQQLGPDSLLGRVSESVVLTRRLRERLAAPNPGLPPEAYDDAVRRVTATAVDDAFK